MKNQTFTVLANRQFLFLWLAEIFSQIAFNMANFILILTAFKLANSNTAVSVIVLSFTMPAIIFGIIAGACVDRWDKKTVLFATNIARFFLLILLAVFHTNLLLIYIFSFVTAIITQFFIPAETPMIPVLVKKNLLLSANALFGMGLYGSIFVAYALSGPFIILFGHFYSLLITALFFFLASLCILFIKVPKSKRLETDSLLGTFNNRFPAIKTLRTEINSALRLIAKTKDIYHSLFLLTLAQVIILIMAVIGPGFTRQILGINIEQFPLLVVTPAAFGLVMGAVIIGNFFNKYSKQKMANIGVFLSGTAILFLPYGSKVASRQFIATINEHLPRFLTIDILHIVILLAFILGFANALVFVPSNTILQEKTSDQLRGKVYGALNALTGLFSLFPIIIAGEAADLFGVAHVLTGIGISLLVIGLFRMIPK